MQGHSSVSPKQQCRQPVFQPARLKLIEGKPKKSGTQKIVDSPTTMGEENYGGLQSSFLLEFNGLGFSLLKGAGAVFTSDSRLV